MTIRELRHAIASKNPRPPQPNGVGRSGGARPAFGWTDSRTPAPAERSADRRDDPGRLPRVVTLAAASPGRFALSRPAVQSDQGFQRAPILPDQRGRIHVLAVGCYCPRASVAKADG